MPSAKTGDFGTTAPEANTAGSSGEGLDATTDTASGGTESTARGADAEGAGESVAAGVGETGAGSDAKQLVSGRLGLDAFAKIAKDILPSVSSFNVGYAPGSRKCATCKTRIAEDVLCVQFSDILSLLPVHHHFTCFEDTWLPSRRYEFCSVENVFGISLLDAADATAVTALIAARKVSATEATNADTARAHMQSFAVASGVGTRTSTSMSKAVEHQKAFSLVCSPEPQKTVSQYHEFGTGVAKMHVAMTESFRCGACGHSNTAPARFNAEAHEGMGHWDTCAHCSTYVLMTWGPPNICDTADVEAMLATAGHTVVLCKDCGTMRLSPDTHPTTGDTCFCRRCKAETEHVFIGDIE